MEIPEEGGQVILFRDGKNYVQMVRHDHITMKHNSFLCDYKGQGIKDDLRVFRTMKQWNPAVHSGCDEICITHSLIIVELLGFGKESGVKNTLDSKMGKGRLHKDSDRLVYTKILTDSHRLLFFPLCGVFFTPQPCFALQFALPRYNLSHIFRAVSTDTPSASAICSAPASLILFTEPNFFSSAFLRFGPIPGISSSMERVSVPSRSFL